MFQTRFISVCVSRGSCNSLDNRAHYRRCIITTNIGLTHPPVNNYLVIHMYKHTDRHRLTTVVYREEVYKSKSDIIIRETSNDNKKNEITF